MKSSNQSASPQKKPKRKLMGFKEWCAKKCKQRVLPKGSIHSKRYSLWGGRIWDRMA